MNRILMSTLLSLSMGVASAQTQNVEVVELHPAPGQFVNTMPQAEEGTTHEEVCKEATEALNDGLDGINILTRIIGEFRTYGVKNIPIRTIIGGREIEGFHLIRLAIHNHRLRLHIVIISTGIDAEILSSLRHFAIEIDAARIDGLNGFHRLSIHHLHGGFILMSQIGRAHV